MTISGTTTEVAYTGDGSVVAFTVTFPFFGTGSTSELEVVERVIATGVETIKTYSTHYTVTGGVWFYGYCNCWYGSRVYRTVAYSKNYHRNTRH